MSESSEIPETTPPTVTPDSGSLAGQQGDEPDKTGAESASKPPPATAPVPPASRFDPGSVLWTVLWSVILALGIAAGATTWERIETRANSRGLLLLPSTESSEADREQWLQHLLQDLGFDAGEWLSPKSLVQQVSATVPSEMWAELFSDSDAWLPWLLRLQPGKPLEDVPAFSARLGNLRADPRFRLVLYDETALRNDAHYYRRVRHSTFIGAGVLMAVGILALLLSPFTTCWRFDIPLGALLGVGLTALGWYGLNRSGFQVDREQGLRALITAFGLAALFGPMLKGRITQYLRRRGE